MEKLKLFSYNGVFPLIFNENSNSGAILELLDSKWEIISLET